MCQRRHLPTCCSWGNWALAPVHLSCIFLGAHSQWCWIAAVSPPYSPGQWYTIEGLGAGLQRRLAGIRYLSLWVMGVRRHLLVPQHEQTQHCQTLAVSHRTCLRSSMPVDVQGLRHLPPGELPSSIWLVRCTGFTWYRQWNQVTISFGLHAAFLCLGPQ
jgi:hypothetical protein